MSASIFSSDTLVTAFEIALAAGTIYGFCHSYFTDNRPQHTQKAARDETHASSSHPATEQKTTAAASTTAVPKPVRVYMDGCFDCMHFGHANALRQAKALGDILVVGINPAREILLHKGPPVMSDDERFTAVSSVKWVDEVLTDAPYVVTPQFLHTLIHEHQIDIIVHGDDPCVGADGLDVYHAVKAMGRFRTIKRTEGVSSTDIVARMLRCTDHSNDDLPSSVIHNLDSTQVISLKDKANPSASAPSHRPFIRVSAFLPTTRRIIQFAGQTRAPKVGERVVYIDGSFDMFHAGHIETFKRARRMGDFLIVGIHDDHTVNARKHSMFPIMNLHERTLAVLSSRFVDEVIIGAPFVVTEDMITTMNISIVVHGTYHSHGKHSPEYALQDPYVIPRSMDIVRSVESHSSLNVETILQRVVAQRDAYVRRNLKKEASETEYITKHKTYVVEN